MDVVFETVRIHRVRIGGEVGEFTTEADAKAAVDLVQRVLRAGGVPPAAPAAPRVLRPAPAPTQTIDNSESENGDDVFGGESEEEQPEPAPAEEPAAATTTNPAPAPAAPAQPHRPSIRDRMGNGAAAKPQHKGNAPQQPPIAPPPSAHLSA